MKVTFDIDDVIIPLTGYTLKSLGIDINKITSYMIESNEGLTEHEKHSIIDSYQDVEVFRRAGYNKDIKLVKRLVEKYGLEVIINSNSFNHEIMDYKYNLIRSILPFIKEDDIHLNLIDKSSVMSKRIDDTDIIVEDNYSNIINAINYRYGVLIDYPHNRDIELPGNIYRESSLKSGIVRIEEIVKSSIK